MDLLALPSSQLSEPLTLRSPPPPAGSAALEMQSWLVGGVMSRPTGRWDLGAGLEAATHSVAEVGGATPEKCRLLFPCDSRPGTGLNRGWGQGEAI